jgi:hypothetical protein
VSQSLTPAMNLYVLHGNRGASQCMSISEIRQTGKDYALISVRFQRLHR